MSKPNKSRFAVDIRQDLLLQVRTAALIEIKPLGTVVEQALLKWWDEYPRRLEVQRKLIDSRPKSIGRPQVLTDEDKARAYDALIAELR